MAAVRTDFDPAETGPRRFYPLMTSVVVPRPMSRLGRDEWGRPPEVAEISRISVPQWPGHYSEP